MAPLFSDAFTNYTMVYDERGHTMSGTDDDVRRLGPSETGSEAMLAVRPDDGSLTGPEALFDLLKSTLHGTGVRLGGWESAIEGDAL